MWFTDRMSLLRRARQGPRGVGLLAVLCALSVSVPASAESLEAGEPAASWVFRGSGWGHSLRMSQYGAMEMAKDGRAASQILGHYYTGTTYDAVTDTQTLRVNVLHHVTSVTATPVAIVTGGGAFTVALGGATMSGGLVHR